MDPLAQLLTLEQFGIKLGLENIRTLCRALGHPQEAYRTILVAGTNGKGSVTAWLETALRAAGYRSARYTSPHLIALEERFVVDGQPVSVDSLRAVAGGVLTLVDDLRARGELAVCPTFFEVATAMAFELFRQARVEFAVLEVGLGGRFDATNVVTSLVSVITTIDLDHQRYLGYSISAIAEEKAGVVKDGRPLVVGETKPEAMRVFETACREHHAVLVRANQEVTHTAELVDGRTRLMLTTPTDEYGPLVLSLRGGHQVQNAITAVRTLEVLRSLDVRLPREAILTGLTETIWPGRLDLWTLPSHQTVLLDAAHNPAGATALASYLREVYQYPVPVVFGVSRDKDIAPMLGQLMPGASRLIVTRSRTARGEQPQALAALARQIDSTLRLDVAEDVASAVELALQEAEDVVVTGSIFVVGEALALLAERRGRRS